MSDLDETKVQCPYCGEIIDILIDGSEPHQNYIEDCQVCCRPITFDVTVETEDEVTVLVFNENQ
ncbi:MAG: CPXCG motif-containing cysteine-rich protein [Methylococcales bacterium]|nr:CPXCG motif-containing cysteine-rich protein [Methylococcales bacterium]